MSNILGNKEKVLELEAPGCSSIRECSIRFVAVIGIRNRDNPKVLRIIHATRDYRGEKRKVRI